MPVERVMADMPRVGQVLINLVRSRRLEAFTQAFQASMFRAHADLS